MDKKNYNLEFLYDNGIIETYATGEITEKELMDVVNIAYESFSEGLSAVLQVPNGKGSNAIINVMKITRVSILV